MIDLGDAAETTLLGFARTWCARLAVGEWEGALGMLDEPNRNGVVWTRESVLALLDDTFGERTTFAREFGAPSFSAPNTALGPERHGFGRSVGGSYWLDYDVPLNGRFSDLTAQFEFLPREGRFAAVLHDLHVM